jgi:hypothetical protein
MSSSNSEKKMNTEYELVSMHLALIDVPMVNNPHDEYIELNAALGKVIRQAPIVLPFVNDPNIPGNIPVVQAKDTNTGYSINISRSRVDFISALNGSCKIDDFFDYAKKVINNYSNIKFGRLGIVGQFVLDSEEPSLWIKDKFLKNCKNDWKELFIRYNKTEKFDNIVLNNLIQFQEATVRVKGKEEHKVHLQIDVNTPVNSAVKVTSNIATKILDFKRKIFSANGVMEAVK